MAARRREAADLPAIGPSPQRSLADAEQPARLAQAEPRLLLAGRRLDCSVEIAQNGINLQRDEGLSGGAAGGSSHGVEQSLVGRGCGHAKRPFGTLAVENHDVPTPLAPDDDRTTIPLFTAGEAAQYLRVPASTMRNWVRGYEYASSHGRGQARPIVSAVSSVKPSRATIPFIGLAEALVVAGFRQQGLSMQKIRAALQALDREIGIEHVLANRTLYTDGANILWDYARAAHDVQIQQLVEPDSGQRVFVEVVRQYLQLITYDSDWWASQIGLPAFGPTRVVVDMHRGFGRPILDKQRLGVDVVLDRFYRGNDTINDIAMDLELDPSEVENVIRAAWRPAAA